MKKYNLIKGLSAVAAIGLFGACSSDYLDLEPVTDVTDSQITATTKGAALAINGIARSMESQWGGLQGGMSGNAGGEAFINNFFGEAFGQDNLAGVPLGMWSPEIILGGSAWGQENYVMNYVPWKYCYTLIQQANAVLDGIDDAEGTEEERQFIKAEALTFRAHGYTRLMQFYAPRWEDSNNGDFYCAVKRLEGGTGDAPLWKMSEVMDQIYADLHEAIELFNASGMTRDEAQKWLPSVNVAQGILARAALIKHDWNTAKTAAAAARQGYEIMSNDTYFSGFLNDNSSIIWTQSKQAEDIYYWSFGAHFGVNGAYVENWNLGAGAIDYDLYNQLDENDVRRQMFLTPDKTEVINEVNSAFNPGKVTAEDWWNKDLVVSFDPGMDLSKGPFARKDAVNGKWGLYNVALRYCKHYGENIFKGDYEAMNNEGFYAYYKVGTKGDVLLAKGTYGKLASIPFGAQLKFFGEVPYGTSAYPFMRAEEMCLIEAEAANALGDDATAIARLMEINGKRIPGYTCNKSGDELRDEIRLARRIELWGEGFNFFDFKRWNIDIVRRAWVAGDTTSGNWMMNLAHNTPAKCNHGWRMMIPRSEIVYNKGIDRTLIVVNDDPNIY